MLVYSQLKVASLENLSADPVLLPLGRVFFDTVLDRPKIKISSGVKQLVYKDDPVIIGTNGTASTNVKLFRSGVGIAQAVLASDVTAEGSPATTLAQFGFRNQNFTDAGKPTAGNAGRIIWLTDVLKLQYDTGSVWTDIGSLANPMTTGGDLIYGGSGGTAVRLPNGSAGQYLASQGGTAAPVWTSFSPLPTAITSVNTNYTALLTDEFIVVDAGGGSRTIALPTAVGNSGKRYTIKKVDSSANAVVIDPSGAETIDGNATFTLFNITDLVEVVSNGTFWYIKNLSVIKESFTAWTTATYAQPANTYITVPLASISSRFGFYAITASGVTIRKTAYYKVVLKNTFTPNNGESSRIAYSINNGADQNLGLYGLDSNTSGSVGHIEEAREVFLTAGDVIRLRTQITANPRNGTNGFLEVTEL